MHMVVFMRIISHRLKHLNTWWHCLERLWGGTVLLEEVRHREYLRVESLDHFRFSLGFE